MRRWLSAFGRAVTGGGTLLVAAALVTLANQHGLGWLMDAVATVALWFLFGSVFTALTACILAGLTAASSKPDGESGSPPPINITVEPPASDRTPPPEPERTWPEHLLN
jgi:hypothetical protein